MKPPIGLATRPDGRLAWSRLGGGGSLCPSGLTATPAVRQVGLREWWLDTAGTAPTYVVPRESDIVIGGTEQHGEWSRTPDPDTAREILDRAAALVPALRGATVLRHVVGLRPARPSVRLERVGDVVHCYGHGGAGVTLSWGCADEVAVLVGSS